MAAKFKIAILRKTGAALNDVLGLTPPIDVEKGTAAQLTKAIKESLDLLNDDDVFPAEITEVLNHFLPEGMELVAASAEMEDGEEPEGDFGDDDEECNTVDEASDGADESDEAPQEIEPEEEPAPAEKKKAPAKKDAPAAPKKKGVIATIVELLKDAGAAGISFDDLLDSLCEAFPERNAEGMGKTIRIQISTRLRKEKGIPVEYDKESKTYSIAVQSDK